MKFPKHRADCYLVIRYTPDRPAACVGVFPTLEGADNFGEACAQSWADKGFDLSQVDFRVELATYYDA